MRYDLCLCLLCTSDRQQMFKKRSLAQLSTVQPVQPVVASSVELPPPTADTTAQKSEENEEKAKLHRSADAPSTDSSRKRNHDEALRGDTEEQPSSFVGGKPNESSGSATIALERRTGICKPFRINGVCPYGDGCRYAHIYGEQPSGARRLEGKNWAQLTKSIDEDASQSSVSAPSCCSMCTAKGVLLVAGCAHPYCPSCVKTTKACVVCRTAMVNCIVRPL